MRFYETLYLINPNLSDEDYKEVVDKFNELVDKNKGVVIQTDEWGKKSLAYKIKKFDKGFYVLLQYCGEPGVLDGLTRGLRLDDRILKYQTIKLSDKADPEALKAKKEEPELKAAEESKATEEVSSVIEENNGISE